MEAVSTAAAWKVPASLFHHPAVESQPGNFALIFTFHSPPIFFIISFCENFQQQFGLLYENSLSTPPPPFPSSQAPHPPPRALLRPENSKTLRHHYAAPVRRGRLNLQNTSAGARQLFWSAANLSCLPPLWSCLNKNELGGDPGGTKSFRRCRSSAEMHRGTRARADGR